MKSPVLGACAAILLLLAPAALVRAQPDKPVPAPAWKLKALDGTTVTSGQFKGKVVVLDFWATWCGPCKSEIPGYISLQKRYGADGLVVVGISKDDDGPKRQKTVQDYVDSHGMNYTIVFSDDDLEAAFGGIDAIPTTYIIDRDGNIRSKKIGAMSPEEFEKKVLAVLHPAP
jgi:thiol-disulfide isomerase/thioredoxin